MKESLQEFIEDALSRDWPKPKRRAIPVKAHHDRISVLVGMRRKGAEQLHSLTGLTGVFRIAARVGHRTVKHRRTPPQSCKILSILSKKCKKESL